MSDDQGYATGGYVGPPGEGDAPLVPIERDCWWWLPKRQPDDGLRVTLLSGSINFQANINRWLKAPDEQA